MNWKAWLSGVAVAERGEDAGHERREHERRRGRREQPDQALRRGQAPLDRDSALHPRQRVARGAAAPTPGGKRALVGVRHVSRSCRSSRVKMRSTLVIGIALRPRGRSAPAARPRAWAPGDVGLGRVAHDMTARAAEHCSRRSASSKISGAGFATPASAEHDHVVDQPAEAELAEDRRAARRPSSTRPRCETRAVAAAPARARRPGRGGTGSIAAAPPAGPGRQAARGGREVLARAPSAQRPRSSCSEASSCPSMWCAR